MIYLRVVKNEEIFEFSSLDAYDSMFDKMSIAFVLVKRHFSICLRLKIWLTLLTNKLRSSVKQIFYLILDSMYYDMSRLL